MIEKMSYVNIAGPQEEFERIAENYLSYYDIQLENSVLKLDGQDFVSPMTGSDPYKDIQAKAEEIRQMYPETGLTGKKAQKAQAAEEKRLAKKFAGREMNGTESCYFINSLYEKVSELNRKKSEIISEIDTKKAERDSIAPFKGLNYKLEDILGFKYVASRFGRVAKEAWNEFEKNSDMDPGTFFAKCQSDDRYVWGVFFVPENEDSKADSVYAALRFERVKICEKYNGTPTEICEELEKNIADLEIQAAGLQKEIEKTLDTETRDKLWLAFEKLDLLSRIYEAKRLSACIEDDEDFDGVDTTFFFTCGWMRTKDAQKLRSLLDEKEKDIICVLDEAPQDSGLVPPTSIKNKGIFKPYEMYTKMYGLPAYDEFDPTILLAILYSVIFGSMFGDLGHGLVLLIGGAVLYFVKRMQLAGIISLAGFFSSIFGLLYGSFFGFEDIIPTLWLKPKEAISSLPLVGRLNTVFALAIAFGMILSLCLMLLNVICHIKRHETIDSLFTSDGVAGFIFYGTLVLVVMLYMTGKTLPATILIVILLVVPLLCMALKEPLTNVLHKRKAMAEGTGIGMFCVEAFFELFETCLAYFSNTISFVRIGAFAVSHAAMMEVVLSLGGYTEAGGGNIIVLIIGNIFVIGFEGLIVGIQVLRLQYYEIFSKFYKGSGKEFKPFFNRREK